MVMEAKKIKHNIPEQVRSYNSLGSIVDQQKQQRNNRKNIQI